MNKYKLTILFAFFLINNLITNTIFAKAFLGNSDEEVLSLSANTSAMDATCNLCNGSIDVSPIGGQAPYTYSWSNGAVSEDLDNLCLGFYNFTVTDNTGCTFTTGILVDNVNLFQVDLESQADVDEFVMLYGDCQEIIGSLRIGTTFANGPSNISDISGLSNLTTIGSNLNIFQNPNLSSLSGLENITDIGASLHLNSNNALTTISSFQNVTSLLGNFIIDNHSSLLNLEGFNNLESISGDVYISNNTDLNSLSALSQLLYVDGEFDIRIALDLENLNGLEQLEIIGGDFILRDNPMLTDISALDHTIQMDGNVIIENTGLTDCSILPFCNLIQNGSATFTLNNNNTGCNSEAEIEDECNNNTINFTMEGNDITCNGLCDGFINLFQEGAIPPINYEWSTGASGPSPNLFDLCEGTYTATIIDALGITAEASYFVNEPEVLTLEIEIESMACFGECVGAVNYILTGGTPPYSAASANSLCPDQYDVQITDDNGCVITSNFTIINTDPITLDVDQIIDNMPGQSDGSIAISINGGSGPFTYSWLLNGSEVSTMEDPENLGEGIYTLLISDAASCVQTFGPYNVGIETATHNLTNNQINIFPNPAKDNITVSFSNPSPSLLSFSLCTLEGVNIKKGKIEQKENSQLFIGDLPNSIYLLRIISDNGTYLKKIIVNK